MKDNINCPFDKISGYPEYADTKEHSGYVYVEKYTLHGDTYYVAKGRSNLSLKREGEDTVSGIKCIYTTEKDARTNAIISEAVDTIQIEWYE